MKMIRSVLNIGIVTKVVSVDGTPTVSKTDSFGESRLYADGTIRMVRKLTLVGVRMFVQKSSIELSTDGDTFLYYNKWS